MEHIEGNKLIAEFMGGKEQSGFFYSFPFEFGFKEKWDESGFIGSGTTSAWEFDELKYHLLWDDWLMPVVEKIENLNKHPINNFKTEYSVQIGMMGEKNNYNQCTIECPFKKFQVKGISKIDAVWQAVIEFIQWYNNQSKL